MRNCKTNAAYALMTKCKRSDGKKGHLPVLTFACRIHLGKMVERCVQTFGSVRILPMVDKALCEISVE